jgi:hypothetical protein
MTQSQKRQMAVELMNLLIPAGTLEKMEDNQFEQTLNEILIILNRDNDCGVE